MITVQVWDRGVVKAVDKAIRESGLGLNPQTEGQTIRVPIPDLNQERRRELTRKVAPKYAEQARVAVRKVRQHGIEALRKLEKDSEISQDEQRKLQSDIQHLTDDHIKRIDETLSAEGQRDPSGLMSLAAAPPPVCRGISRSSWTATAAGRRPAACRASPATAAAPRRCAGRWSRPANSAFPI